MSEQKNYSDYGYAGDERIEISVQEFVALRKALEKAMENGTRIELPQVLNHFDVTNGTRVKKPTKKKLEEGNLQEFVDNEETFTEKNAKVVYDSNLYPEVYNGLSLLMLIHNRNVDNDIAKPVEELRKLHEQQQQQAEGQNTETTEHQEEVSPENNMNVVRDE